MLHIHAHKDPLLLMAKDSMDYPGQLSHLLLPVT